VIIFMLLIFIGAFIGALVTGTALLLALHLGIDILNRIHDRAAAYVESHR
jgi:hypothetical protein